MTNITAYPDALPRPRRQRSGDCFAAGWLKPRRLARDVALVVALIVVNKLGAPGNALCYAVLLAMAVRSTEGALRALLLSSVIVMGAGGPFVTFSTVGKALKFALLGVTAARVVSAAIRLNPKALQRRHLFWLLAFAVVATVLAFVNDYYVEIVLLKLLSFTAGLFALLVAGQAWYVDRIRLAHWVLAVSCVVAVLCLVAFVVSGGYTQGVNTMTGRVYTGFSGMFGHPQTAGVVAAMLTAMWLVFFVLQSDPLAKKIIVPLAIALVVVIYLSGTRTGLVGLVLALMVAYWLITLRKGVEARRLKRLARKWSSYLLLALSLVVVLELAGVTDFSNSFYAFLAKGDEAALESRVDLTGAFQESRGSLIEYNWDQFKETPWTGVGFGVDTSLEWRRSATLLSASTERGFWPSAVLAEVGLIGALVFLGFLLTLLQFLMRRRNHLGTLLIVVLLVLNLSEMSMFSFGGLGMMSWTLVACGMVLSGNQPPSGRRVVDRRWSANAAAFNPTRFQEPTSSATATPSRP